MAGASLRSVADDIRAMRIRGAAAIAQAAAEALGVHAAGGLAATEEGARILLAARPTAVSLRNGVACVLAAARRAPDLPGPAAQAAARRFLDSVAQSRSAIVAHGARLLHDAGTVLTHCNSTTAVAVLAAAHRQGPGLEVIATETRPFGQGLLTVRALRNAGVPTTLIVDSAVEHALSTRDIGAVLVGADTVARDGSLFNKIGTAGVAALARQHRVPFHIAAGFHKFSTAGPNDVAIEERDPDEILPRAQAPPGLLIHNPVFDRTPARRIASFVTEGGPLGPRRAVRNALARLAEHGVV